MFLVGGHSERVTPVPIPNTEVKSLSDLSSTVFDGRLLTLPHYFSSLYILMTENTLSLLQENSALNNTDIDNVFQAVRLAEQCKPDEVYLTGSSVNNEDYGDIDLALDFSSEIYDESIVDSFMDLLDSSRRIGTEPDSRGKQRVIVRGELSGRDYDIFIMEENTLPSDNRLDLHP